MTFYLLITLDVYILTSRFCLLHEYFDLLQLLPVSFALLFPGVERPSSTYFFDHLCHFIHIFFVAFVTDDILLLRRVFFKVKDCMLGSLARSAGLLEDIPILPEPLWNTNF